MNTEKLKSLEALSLLQFKTPSTIEVCPRLPRGLTPSKVLLISSRELKKFLSLCLLTSSKEILTLDLEVLQNKEATRKRRAVNLNIRKN
jgi:hypothetical protein